MISVHDDTRRAGGVSPLFTPSPNRDAQPSATEQGAYAPRSPYALLFALPFLVLLPLADAPVFVAATVAGKDVRGPLVKFDDWGVELGDKLRRRLSGDEWLSLRQQGVTNPEFPTDEHLVLANGDRVPVQDLRLDDEKLLFRHKDLNDGKDVTVPLTAAALVWRLAPDGTASPELLRRKLLRGGRARDLVLLRNGDTLEGSLTAIKGGEVEVEVNKKPVTVRWTQVAAVAMGTELLDRMTPKSTAARLALVPTEAAPGGRLTLTEAAADGKTLTGKTAFGVSVRVPLERVAALDILSPKVVPLGDLKPTKQEFTPYLDEKWPVSVDANVLGRDLRLADSVYERGVGVHAATRVSYALEVAYRRFDALVGLDDRDGRKGQVKVRVLVDGKPVELGKETLTHADGAVRVNVDVTGAKELTLDVGYATRGPVQAVVNWANARLVR